MGGTTAEAEVTVGGSTAEAEVTRERALLICLACPVRCHTRGQSKRALSTDSVAVQLTSRLHDLGRTTSPTVGGTTARAEVAQDPHDIRSGEATAEIMFVVAHSRRRLSLPAQSLDVAASTAAIPLEPAFETNPATALPSVSGCPTRPHANDQLARPDGADGVARGGSVQPVPPIQLATP